MTAGRAPVGEMTAPDGASRSRRARRRPAPDSHPIVADRSRLGAVCIDMGSVVVDERSTWGLWQSLTVRDLKANGTRVERRQLLQALRSAMLARAPRVSQQALVELGADPARAQAVWSQVTNRDRPLKYAAAALERLAARYPLVMVANQGLHARGLLEAAGLDRYFTRLLLSDELGIAKPDERIFHLALEALGIEPERVAMLGDRLDLDIEPSRRLGMLAIRIRRGPFACQEPHHDDERPHLTFNSLPNAARWLAP
ncbi:MAG: HAD family hydrolase [Chloroflexota bacterium]|nr:HAD family hydrolase [Chloroflexota bacterium]